MLVISDNMNAIAKVKETLHALLCIKDLGDVKYFLGMEIDSNAIGITITLKKCAFNMLKEMVILNQNQLVRLLMLVSNIMWEI